MHRLSVGASCRTGSCCSSLAVPPPKCSRCILSSCSRNSSLNVGPLEIRLGGNRSGTSLPPAFRGRSPSTAAEDLVRRPGGRQTRPNRPGRQLRRWTCFDVTNARSSRRRRLSYAPSLSYPQATHSLLRRFGFHTSTRFYLVPLLTQLGDPAPTGSFVLGLATSSVTFQA